MVHPRGGILLSNKKGRNIGTCTKRNESQTHYEFNTILFQLYNILENARLYGAETNQYCQGLGLKEGFDSKGTAQGNFWCKGTVPDCSVGYI